MKKIKVWFWLFKGFFQKHKKIMFLGNLIGIVLAIFIIWVLPYIPRPNPTTKIGFIGLHTQEDLPNYITSKIGQGLTTILEDGTPVGALAENWSISEDGLAYTFFLREKVFWQDSTELKAKDLEYKFTDVETKIIDDKTIQFKLKNKFTPFPILLSKPALKNKTIGTGEYSIRKIINKGRFIDKIILDSTKDTLIIKFYPTLNFAKTAFKLGEVNKIIDLYQNIFQNEKEWEKSLKIEYKTNYSQYLGLFLNNDTPLFKDKTFRQALAYATQKPSDKTRSYGPISPLSWAYNDDLKPYEYSPTRAKELVEKSLGNLEKVKEIEINISTTQPFLNLAEQVKKDWEGTLGIKVNVQIINVIPPDFQVLLASQEIPPDPDQYTLWHSTQSQNLIKFNNPRIDKLLEDARQEEDKEIRTEEYIDFQRFFVEESPIIFLNHPLTYTIERNSIVDPFLFKILQIGRK